MILEALLFLLFVILVVRPLAQRQRERALAEKLKHIRDPHEAMIAVDNAMHASRNEGRWLARVRESYFFWL